MNLEMNPSESELRQNLCELQEQWRATAKVFRKLKGYELGASVYKECIGELGKILEGDTSPIAKWSDTEKAAK